MNIISIGFAILSTLCISSNQSQQSTNCTLTVKIDNIKANTGNIMLAVYNRNNFLKDRLIQKVVSANSTSLTISFSLPYGEYAIATYQDLNVNQKLDTNFVGIPQEPYGFSNNYRPKFRAPNFDETKLLLTQNTQNTQISLNTW